MARTEASVKQWQMAVDKEAAEEAKKGQELVSPGFAAGQGWLGPAWENDVGILFLLLHRGDFPSSNCKSSHSFSELLIYLFKLS